MDKFCQRISAVLGMFVAGWLAMACSESEPGAEGGTGFPSRLAVAGQVEKGPYVQGSIISLQPLNERLTAIGTVYNGEIQDNRGVFDLGTLSLPSPYARLTAVGYFFNEVKGTLSQGTLTLHGIADLRNKASMNVNLLSHLKAGRIQTLMGEGRSFAEADNQAQVELLTQFGLQRFAGTDFAQVSITDGSEAAAALIAVSSLVLASRSEAELTEYIATLSRQLATNGQFSAETRLTLTQDRDFLRNKTDDIATHIIQRYRELGLEVSVQNLLYYFDWDNDGMAGNELNDNPHITLSQTAVHFGKDGGQATVSVTANFPVFIESPVEGPYDNISSGSYFSQFFQAPAPLSVHTTWADNTLTIQGEANRCAESRKKRIPLYNILGDTVAVVTVSFDGNPDYPPVLSDVGRAVSSTVAYSLMQAVSLDRDMQLQYGGIDRRCDFTPPVTAYNPCIETLWTADFKTVNQITQASKALTEAGYTETALAFQLYNAILYTAMMYEWGDVPLCTPENVGALSLPRNARATIRTHYTNLLNTLLATAVEKKAPGVIATAEDLVFPSKDLVRMALADLYLQGGDYHRASELYATVVKNYAFDNAADFHPSNSEILLGFVERPESIEPASLVHPVYVLSDIYLRLAECSYRMGNGAAAQAYLDQVVQAYPVPVSAPDDVLHRINAIRRHYFYPGYFAFLKRNGFIGSLLQLEDYQQLWPIPQSCLDRDAALTQNPRY